MEPVHDYITGDPFRIMRCHRCGVLFTFPLPSDMERYYPARYRGYGPLVTFLLRALYRASVRKWTRLFSHPGAALEIGCGAGLMLEAFRELGWQVMGIERNEAMAEHARSTYGLHVVSTGIAELPRAPTFDLIIMFHVLEHLADPLTMLRECAARLTPAGRVVLAVPNAESWQARFAGVVWPHLDPPRHLIHFSPESLESALQKAGMRTREFSFVSPIHDPYGWVESVTDRITGRTNTMTRHLMGMAPFNGWVLLSYALWGLLAAPALLLATASWAAGQGALMEVVAERVEQPGGESPST
jgi:SAM-dependent methyltransferase